MSRERDSFESDSYRRGEKRSLDSLESGGSAIGIASKRANLGSGTTPQTFFIPNSGFLPLHLAPLPFILPSCLTFSPFAPSLPSSLFLHLPSYLFNSLSDDEEAFVKFLVPSVVPGMIIGSGGATIAELMDTTQTTVKFSRGQEQYPGTNDRVCCICGPVPNICEAVREVFSRMNDPSHTR